MMFLRKDRTKIISKTFPPIMLEGKELKFVTEFKYLGHIILHDFRDDTDIDREIRSIFFRANMLVRKFGKCSAAVKITLFKSYCLNMYDSALWYTTLAKLLTIYRLAIISAQILFGYSKRFSVTQMLLELRLPSFATVLLNGTTVFRRMWSSCFNSVVQFFYSVCHIVFMFLSIYVCRFCLSTLLCMCVCVIWALCLKNFD